MMDVLAIILLLLVLVCLAICADLSYRLASAERRNNIYKETMNGFMQITNESLSNLAKIDRFTFKLISDVAIHATKKEKDMNIDMNNKQEEPKFEKTADMDDPSVPKEVQDKEKAKDLTGIELTRCTNTKCNCIKLPYLKED